MSTATEQKWKRFEDSRFVICWGGECATSALVDGWDAVLSHIDEEMGLSEADSCRNPENEFGWGFLDADDEWHHADCPILQEGDSSRLKLSGQEVDEGVYLTIIRVMEFEAPALSQPPSAGGTTT